MRAQTGLQGADAPATPGSPTIEGLLSRSRPAEPVALPVAPTTVERPREAPPPVPTIAERATRRETPSLPVAPTTVEITNTFNLQGTSVGAQDVAREVELSLVQGVAGRASG